MSIVTKLNNLIDKYAVEIKCGFCWEFTYARKDYANLKKYHENNKCCIHFILEDYSSKKVFDVSDNDIGSELKYINHSITAFIGSKSNLTKQIYNENPDYEKEDGKYYTHVKPIEDCLEVGFEVDMCDGGNAWVSIGLKPKYNYKDANLDGVMLTGVFREYFM